MAEEPAVFIVDDDAAVRDAVKCLVESVGLKAVSFSSAMEFLDGYRPGCPGCLVLDVRMAGISGLDLQRELSLRSISLPIVFITGHGDIPMAVQALKQGAVDFLEKPFRNQILLDKIHEALERDAEHRRRQSETHEIELRYTGLTDRERQVLDLLLEGKPNKLIAKSLGLSPRTVEFHRAHVMQKMGARSISELVRMVMDLRQRK